MEIVQELAKCSSRQKAETSAKFFKTGKGEYSEGDVFIGVTVPEQRKIAKKYADLPINEISKLLNSKVHEHRMTGLIILTERYRKTKDEKIAEFYFSNTKHINNWDLVDVSAPIIAGPHTRKLNELAESKDLWEKRIAIVGTLYGIRNGEFGQTLRIAEKYIDDKHDLIQKATGWMLREAGKKDEKVLTDFLDEHYKKMPRTMLRYSIERLNAEQKKRYMK